LGRPFRFRNPRGGKADENLSQASFEREGRDRHRYGLIAALIAVAAITAMQGVGTSLNSTFTNVSTKMG
jgi:pilus assembly protein Flp/PilA